jgi:uncharacterized protein (DUF1697 family)
MPRYVAFLRGVSPLNASMHDLRRSFEAGGFANVKTVLGSGNVVFDARSTSEASLEQTAETVMHESLGRTFYTIVRPLMALRAVLDSDPYAHFKFPPAAKRVVSFLRKPAAAELAFPIESDGVQILGAIGREVFTAYVPSVKGPVFMKLLESTFGREVTTRTWETVKKCAAA